MTGKKSTTIDGLLMHPLFIGACALIFHAGTFIRTSSVVAIHDASAEQICFETRNTHYTLRLSPAPQSASNPVMLGRAA